MMSSDMEHQQLIAKIQSMQLRLEHLRLGRRILMNLLEATQEEKDLKIKKLLQENEHLRKKNRKYATQLMQMRSKERTFEQ